MYPKAHEMKLKHEELTVAGMSQMFVDCPSEDGKYYTLVWGGGHYELHDKR